MGKTCTFFGHSEIYDDFGDELHNVLTELIEKRGVDTFYVGNQGTFDNKVKRELEKLSKVYPTINYYVVLAYRPIKKDENDTMDYSKTIYPGELETVPLKFAIDRRNKLLIDLADIVVTYVIFPFGGAAKFKSLAERNGKEIINIAEMVNKK